MVRSTLFPPDVRIRPATYSDIDAVLQLRRSLGEIMLTTNDLHASWQWLDLRNQTWAVIGANEELIGYAELQQLRPAWFMPRVWVQADNQKEGIGTVLLQMMEEQAHLFTTEASCHLLAQVWRREVAAQRLLEKAGDDRTSTFQVMELQMTEPVVQPEALDDIVIRPFASGHDEQGVYEADEEAFLDERGKLPRTFEQWSSRLNMHTSHFDPSLWFVAWDQTTIAGTLLSEAVSGVGEIMHLGVRRAWRRRGLGMLLLHSSLREFYQRGISTIRLNVDAQSLTNAHLLYERAGFQTVDAYMNYIRIV